MQLSPRNFVMLLAAAGVLAAAAPASASPGKLLVSTYNEGLQPHSVLQGHSKPLANPKQITVVFSGLVKAADVTGRFTIKCTRNGRQAFSRTYQLNGPGPGSRTVPLKGFSSCRVASADARFVDEFVEGYIQIRAYGK